ncbi:MAG: TfoX/Sxy family protein [Steroidobacteraceae bacterium]|jgi:DNA transformation protein|nr:TfoX/Sxy family protein [Steroidobacteraceae bacterium]
MRNSKVRRRIAAGKLRLRIRDLRNLGPRSETLLERIGVRSVEALRRRGAVEAYVALRRIGATRSLNMLWAMAGALDPWPEGCDWRDVAAGEQRLALLLAVDAAEPGGPPASRQARSPRRRRGGRGAPSGTGGASGGAHPVLGAWAPGLPFDDAVDPGGTAGVPDAPEADEGEAATGAASRVVPARKTRSRRKAGS